MNPYKTEELFSVCLLNPALLGRAISFVIPSQRVGFAAKLLQFYDNNTLAAKGYDHSAIRQYAQKWYVTIPSGPSIVALLKRLETQSGCLVFRNNVVSVVSASDECRLAQADLLQNISAESLLKGNTEKASKALLAALRAIDHSRSSSNALYRKATILLDLSSLLEDQGKIEESASCYGAASQHFTLAANMLKSETMGQEAAFSAQTAFRNLFQGTLTAYKVNGYINFELLQKALNLYDPSLRELAAEKLIELAQENEKENRIFLNIFHTQPESQANKMIWSALMDSSQQQEFRIQTEIHGDARYSVPFFLDFYSRYFLEGATCAMILDRSDIVKRSLVFPTYWVGEMASGQRKAQYQYLIDVLKLMTDSRFRDASIRLKSLRRQLGKSSDHELKLTADVLDKDILRRNLESTITTYLCVEDDESKGLLNLIDKSISQKRATEINSLKAKLEDNIASALQVDQEEAKQLLNAIDTSLSERGNKSGQ